MLQPKKYKKKAKYIGFREILYKPLRFNPFSFGLANCTMDIKYKTIPKT